MNICTNYLNSFSVNAGVGAGAGSGAGARAGPEFRPGKLGVVEPGVVADRQKSPTVQPKKS